MINITKSQPAPECLEIEKRKVNSDNYKCGDVVKRLAEDFFDKCYLCEKKNIIPPNVEHFIPHGNDKDKKFDWDNLFYCCVHCNTAKGTLIDILNCTNPEHKILEYIEFKTDIIPHLKFRVVILAKQNNPIVLNTVSLLTKIYNGGTEIQNKSSEYLIIEIEDIIKKFLKRINKYITETDQNEKAKCRNQIIAELQPNSAFTAFKAWYILNNENLKQEFGTSLP